MTGLFLNLRKIKQKKYYQKMANTVYMSIMPTYTVTKFNEDWITRKGAMILLKIFSFKGA